MAPFEFLAAMAAFSAVWMERCEAAEDLAAATIRDLDLQVDLPRAHEIPDISLPVPDLILWIIAAAAVAFLLYRAKDLFRRRRADTSTWTDPAQEESARRAEHLARAEGFADQGLFVEAIHELLMESFRVIRDREPLSDSRTSREILRMTGLTEQAREALRAIVSRVEWTWFGARGATLEDYRACRESFDILWSP